MKKEEVAGKMKVDKVAQRAFRSMGFHAGQKGKESLEIANPKKGKNMRAGKMVREGNEHNRP